MQNYNRDSKCIDHPLSGRKVIPQQRLQYLQSELNISHVVLIFPRAPEIKFALRPRHTRLYVRFSTSNAETYIFEDFQKVLSEASSSSFWSISATRRSCDFLELAAFPLIRYSLLDCSVVSIDESCEPTKCQSCTSKIVGTYGILPRNDVVILQELTGQPQARIEDIPDDRILSLLK